MNWKAVGNVLGFNIDTAYCSPFVLPSESEGLSDWTERTISFIRHLTSNYVRKGERVLIVTHGFSVVAIPWITMSEHPPLLGYCCLAATFRRPFSTSMSVSTRHLEVGLPPAILSVEDDVTLWLSAAEGIDRDTAGCICAWRDRGVHGYTAAQPRGIFRPKFGPSRTLKHVSVAIFDGNDDFLLAPVAESLRSFTIAALVKPARLLDLELLFSVDPYKEAAGLELRVDKTGAVGVFAGNTAVAVARNALILNRWSIVIVRVRNGREARVWVDFTRCVAGGALKGVCTSFGPWQGLHIFGGSPSVRPFCGSLAELIVVNKALGDPQIDQLNNYFVSKF